MISRFVPLTFPNISETNSDQRRQSFTQETVSAVSAQFPGNSVVMSNVDYTISCAPEVVQHTSYKAKVGSNVSYDVLIIGAGCKFTLKGDGGFQNVSFSPIFEGLECC